MEWELAQRSFRVERKNITFELCRNSNGRFLRITEEVRGRFNTIIVPEPGLESVLSSVDEIIAFSKTLSPGPHVVMPLGLPPNLASVAVSPATANMPAESAH